MPIFKAKDGKPAREAADFSGWNVHTHTPGAITERHFHDSDELVVIAYGRMLVRTEGTEAVLEPGDSVLTPAGEPHEWLALDEAVSIHVKGRLAGQKRRGHLH
jgi:quercetin dioxygenase-like cupin family protein